MIRKDMSVSAFARRGVLVFATLLLTIFPNASVYAQQKRLSSSPDFLMNNGVLYYDPGSGKGCVSGAQAYSTSMDLPTLTGNDNAEKIWNFLKQEDFSDEQAAGLMGNIRQESNFDPTAEENPESAALHDTRPVGYGLIQWSGSRRNDLIKFASGKGLQESDLALQLLFLKHEASTTPLWNWQSLFENFSVSGDDNAWDALKNIDDGIDKTTKFFHDAFERSGDYTNHGGIGHRVESAKEIYENFTGKSAGGAGGGGSSTFGGSDCKPFAGGDLQQTVLEYAWPEYHEAPYLTMRPAYAEAVKRAQAEGRGVGGNENPGIDCAGFVSLLVVDSGFDPEFNYKGKYSYHDAGADGDDIIRGWMEDNWEELGVGTDLNVSDLQPGDVGVTYPGNGSTITDHIFIHVGQIDGFSGQFASSSVGSGEFSWRAPMAAASSEESGNYENVGSSTYKWFRKK